MMTKTWRLLISIVLGSFLLARYAQPASACTCAINPSLEAEFEISAAVFTGRVVRIDLPKGLDTGGRHPVRVTLQVDTVWKGPIKDRIEVFTGIDSGGCGFDFNAGWTYLVYARGVENVLEVNSCTRTAMLSFASEDLASLGDGIQVNNQWLPDQLPLFIVLGSGVGLLVLLGISKRKQRSFHP